MQVIESGLTFFECVARSLGNMNGRQVHDALLYYFVKVVFSNATDYATYGDFCDAIRDGETKHLQLNAYLMDSAAVKQWVRRFHAVEQSVAKTPDVWFHSYPKLLKGAMLRFFWYHRKPHRCYCKYVFSHLVADFYNCMVGVVEGSSVRWFYPLDAAEYFPCEPWANPFIVVRQEENTSFSLIELQLQDVPQFPPLLLLVPTTTTMKEGGEEEEEHHSFVLRVSREITLANGKKSRKNEPVGEFEAVGNGVYVCTYTPDEETLQEDIYQVYPGNAAHCFFKLGLGEVIFVYCVLNHQTCTVCARHDMNDQYPFFKALPDTTHIVVVISGNLGQSAAQLMKQTDFCVYS